MSEVILDTLIDSIKLVPFLFLTYLAMEYLEHKAGEKTTHMVRKAGKMGPLIGGVAGVLPQCGFSAAASNLYCLLYTSFIHRRWESCYNERK